MIDVENEILTLLKTALTNAFTTIYVYSEPPSVISKYPCVLIEEIDNYSYSKTEDSGSNENHAVIVYEVSVWSNKTNGKKAECKKILSVVDSELLSLGFIRKFKNSVTMSDSTVCRMICDYEAVISDDKTIYRR